MDQRNDSYGSLLLQTAAARQYGTQMVDLGGMAFGARWAYSQGGLLARVIDMPADLATARGVTVEGGSPELYSEMDRLNLLDSMSDGLRWSLLDGGGALILLSQDSGTLDQPLDVNTLQVIEEFRVVSLNNIKGGDRKYSDPKLPNYGMPEYYDVTITDGAQPVEVHESRMIEIPGAPMASVAGMNLRNVPWAGRGLSPKAVLAIQRYQRGVNWAEKLLERSQQAVHSMEGLASMLLAKQEPVIRARIDLVDGNRSAINGVAIDSKDSYTITSTTLSGVKDTLDQLQVAVSAEIGYPVTILFGRSPGGLNSTGDSEWDVVFAEVNHLQKRRLGKAMERAVSLIYAQTQSPIKEKPDTWRVCWNPLKQQTEQQVAEVENKKADTKLKLSTALEKLQGTQAISQDEAHAYLAAEHMFGLEPPEDSTGQSRATQYARQT